jgi:hypothetical protein
VLGYLGGAWERDEGGRCGDEAGMGQEHDLEAVGPENLKQLKSLKMPIYVIIFEPDLASPIRHSG